MKMKHKNSMLAMDKNSVRSYDKNGNLHVEKSNISKADVNDYIGNEIPNWQELGLDPDKIYSMYRPADELKKAVDSFKNLPLLLGHQPTFAALPARDKWMGTIGSNVEFKDPYLVADLCVWDNDAISAIESDMQRELSSSYHYTPVLEDGEFNGKKYQIKMTDIRGNHVALVPDGRAGSDVLVNDSKPEELNMPEEKKKEDEIVVKDAEQGIKTAVAKILGKDADEIDGQLVQSLIDAASKANKKEEESEGEPIKDSEQDNGKKDDMKQTDKKDAPAMDANSIFQKAKAEAKAEAQKAFIDIRNAEKEVYDLVGDVAMDSADEIRAYALKQSGVDISGVHPSAYSSMIKMVKAQKVSQEQILLAKDSRHESSIADSLFPNK